jgi:hypothetical protein
MPSCCHYGGSILTIYSRFTPALARMHTRMETCGESAWRAWGNKYARICIVIYLS